MKIEYNKLIRDKIPEIIRDAGKDYSIEVMTENEYRKALLTKLVEEAEEAVEAESNKLNMELADILEVIEAIMDAYKISEDHVQAIKEKRREERGGFNKRLKLLWTE